VLFQYGIVAPVHDGVEVEVDCFAVCEPGGEAGFVQCGEESLLSGVLKPIGVGGQGGGFGQGGQSGEQGGCGVGGDVIDVGDPAGGGELDRQQGQDGADCWDHSGAGIAGGVYQAGQVQCHQIGDGQQQSGQSAVGVGGQGVEVDRLGAWLVVASWQAAFGVRAGP
jgi:hypothetical protein